MLEDRRLLRRLRAGDSDALARIYEKYIEDLLRVAACLLRDPQAAEDCLHDVFVHFAGNPNDASIRSLRSYLVSCVANRARDYLRRKARRLAREPECGAPITSDGPVAQLITAEESARILEALAKLPCEQREVFVLRVHGEMTFRRIAGLQEISVNSAHSRYRYALRKLQSLLHEEYKR